MGQRSIICVKVGNELIARYYQWNYGERMVSRARGLIEWLEDDLKYIEYLKSKIYRIADTNFDMKDVVVSTDLVEEFKAWEQEADFNESIFYSGGNDGKLFILIDGEDMKYAFTDNDMNVLNGAMGYLMWDRYEEGTEEDCLNNLPRGSKTYTKKNIAFLNKRKQMTQEELDEQFMNNVFDNDPTKGERSK